MSTLESADNAMQEVVKALKETELERINSISSIEGIVTSLEGFWRTEWYEQNKYLAERWRKKDPELLELAEKNRKEFKL
jgi:lantibiotic modifying enzyme